MTRPTFPLTTARLHLRLFDERDLDAVHDIERRPEVDRYLYWESRTRDEARAALDRRVKMTSLDDDAAALRLAVVRRDSGELIGDFSLALRSREYGQGEIGFMFHPDHQGQGYAAEAGRAVLELGFETYGLHRVFGSCDARNTPSARLLERLGMRLEATLRETEFVKGTWCDELIYAILADEWRHRRAATVGEPQ
ncbi:MAG: GNAT family N-acetyltransferase [Candidatus Limnocylindrales bacterium]